MFNPVNSIREWYSNARPNEGWAKAGADFVFYRLKSAPMALSAVADAATSAFKGIANAFSSVYHLGNATFSWIRGKDSVQEFSKAKNSAQRTANYAMRTALFAVATPLAPLATLVKPSLGAGIYETAHFGIWLHEDVIKDAKDTRDTSESFDADWPRADYYLNGKHMNPERNTGVKGISAKANYLAAIGGDQEQWKKFLFQGWAGIALDALLNRGINPSGKQSGFVFDVYPSKEQVKIVIKGKCPGINLGENPFTADPKSFDYTRTTVVDPKTMRILSSYLVIKEEL